MGEREEGDKNLSLEFPHTQMGMDPSVAFDFCRPGNKEKSENSQKGRTKKKGEYDNGCPTVTSGFLVSFFLLKGATIPRVGNHERRRQPLFLSRN